MEFNSIQINAFAPGTFPSKGAWRLFPSEAFPLHLRVRFFDYGNETIKPVGEHQEFANLAAYQMSDFAAYLFGEFITIEGGEWIYGEGEFNQLNEIPTDM